MSVKHTAWVWDHSRAEGGTLLVALALADSVNSAAGDDHCWPKQEQLSKRTRLSKRQVQRAVRELEALGELSIERDGKRNRYTMFMATPTSSDDTMSRDTHVAHKATPMSSEQATPMSSPYVEPEVRTRKEPEDLAETFSFWQSTAGQPDAHLSPSRERFIKKLLAEEPNVEILKRCIEAYGHWRQQRGGDRWELTDAFSTFKGRDRENKPEWGTLRDRINWLLSLSRPEPLPGSRRAALLDDMRFTYASPQRSNKHRADEAQRILEEAGYRIVFVDGPPFVRAEW